MDGWGSSYRRRIAALLACVGLASWPNLTRAAEPAHAAAAAPLAASDEDHQVRAMLAGATQALGACWDVADPSPCVLDAIARNSPWAAGLVAAASGRLPDAPSDAPFFSDDARGMADLLLPELAVQLARRGATPDVALARIDAAPAERRAMMLSSICTASLEGAPAGEGPRFLATAASRRPPAALVAAAAERLSRLAPAPAADPECAAAVGDFGAADAAMMRQAPPGMGVQMLAEQGVELRLRAGRLEDAMALALRAPASEQRLALTAVLRAADEAGRPDLARRAAETILSQAVSSTPLISDEDASDEAPNAPLKAVAWVLGHEDASTAAAWVERLDAADRPGLPRWNDLGALATHRAWLALGRPDRARAYRLAVQGGTSRLDRADVPDVQRLLLHMGAAEGRWGPWLAQPRATAREVFDTDMWLGLGVRYLDDRLAHAASPGERAAILADCVAPPASPRSVGLVYWLAPPLSAQADCARRAMVLAAARPDADPGQHASPLLLVALRAVGDGRPELAREMLRLYLGACRTGATRSASNIDIIVLIGIAANPLPAAAAAAPAPDSAGPSPRPVS